MKLLTLIIFSLLILTSCVTVKEYEKININDPDMELSTKGVERFEINFQVYREAASGANGGKTGGGCGCN
ncbi:MAG: DUF4266 domain-containing protein [Cyclobacteriaceae bacterium]|nr:DUF4266 domain-containing protein [Cyclobacteriaceae bacterium]